MYINITDSENGNNKATSGTLVHYLDKENRLYKLEEPILWFNGNSSTVQSYEVKNKLDGNIAKLGRDDSKFFLINISPSEKEISHLKELYGEDGAREKLKEYAVKVMDAYAKNFMRSDINSNTDLLWFGKLENHRYYSHKDKEVPIPKKRYFDTRSQGKNEIAGLSYYTFFYNIPIYDHSSSFKLRSIRS